MPRITPAIPRDVLGSLLLRHYMSGGPVPPSVNYAPTASPATQKPGGAPVPAPMGAAGATQKRTTLAPGAGSPGGTNPYGMTGATSSQGFSSVPNSVSWSAQAPMANVLQGGQYNDSQAALGRMLMAQANGQGPNPWAQQLQNATDANIRQAMALAQSTPGMSNMAAARQAAEGAANAQQQAAGQYAQQLAAQQLGAEGQLAGLNAEQQKLALSQAQGNQGAITQANQQNEDITKANQQAAQVFQGQVGNVVGGVLNAAGAAAAGAAKGGGGGGDSYTGTTGDGQTVTAGTVPVDTSADQTSASDYQPISVPQTEAHGGLIRGLLRHYDEGGSVSALDAPDIGAPVGTGASATWTSPASSLYASKSAVLSPVQAFTQDQLAAQAKANAAARQPKPSDEARITGDILGPIVKALPGASLFYGLGSGIGKAAGADTSQGDAMMKAHGGLIAALAAAGGGVPGRAHVMGNSLRNDTVPAMLSPGEIVLPRSVTEAADSPKKAAAFVAAIKREHGAAPPKKSKTPASLGELLDAIHGIHARLDQLSRGAA